MNADKHPELNRIAAEALRKPTNADLVQGLIQSRAHIASVQDQHALTRMGVEITAHVVTSLCLLDTSSSEQAIEEAVDFGAAVTSKVFAKWGITTGFQQDDTDGQVEEDDG